MEKCSKHLTGKLLKCKICHDLFCIECLKDNYGDNITQIVCEQCHDKPEFVIPQLIKLFHLLMNDESDEHLLYELKRQMRSSSLQLRKFYAMILLLFAKKHPTDYIYNKLNFLYEAEIYEFDSFSDYSENILYFINDSLENAFNPLSFLYLTIKHSGNLVFTLEDVIKSIEDIESMELKLKIKNEWEYLLSL